MTYEIDIWHQRLAEQLCSREGAENVPDNLKLLFQVELGIRLLEHLTLWSEPVNVLWVLLQGLPLPDERIKKFNVAQKHQLAIARVLLPFTGRFTWENALQEYHSIPSQWRCYEVIDQHKGFLLVDNCRRSDQREEHLQVYDRVLREFPKEKSYARPSEAGDVWFEPHLRDKAHRPKIRIEIKSEYIEWAQRIPHTPLKQRDTPKPFSIAYEDLLQTASFLDGNSEPFEIG